MTNFLFDTNLLLLFLRDDPRRFSIKKKFDFERNNNFISVITLGELHSIALRNQWGEKRFNHINKLERDFTIADIYSENIIDSYGQIDAFSQGKLKGRPLSMSARNMGKNDLWIAATASALALELITTDQDFDHLNFQFLRVHTIDIQLLK